MKEGNVYKWSFIDRVSIAVINLTTNLVLARLLSSADFGLLAMIAIFIAIANDFSGCGLSDGLIHKQRPTELDYSTVFIFNGIFGIIFSLSFFFGARLVAEFFGHEELVDIMRILGVCFFFQSMSYVQETRLRKQLKMKSLCIARVGATLTVSVLGIIVAAMGYGYKALICTQILLSFFFFLYYTVASRWFPKIQFSMRAFKEFFNYGVHLMLAYFAARIGKNINMFVLGRFYSSPSLSGIYYQGAKLSGVPYGVSEASLTTPFFVVASNEDDELKRAALIKRMTGTMFSINLSLLTYMLMIAAPIILFMFGSKWAAVVPVFRILAVADCLFCFKQFFITVCKVHGRTVFVRNMGFCEVVFQLLLLLVFYRYGILWIAATQLFGVAFAVGVYSVYCSRRVGAFGLRELAGIFGLSAWLPAVAALVGFAVSLLLPVACPLFVQCMALTLAYAAVTCALGALTGSGVYPLLKARLLARKEKLSSRK